MKRCCWKINFFGQRQALRTCDNWVQKTVNRRVNASHCGLPSRSGLFRMLSVLTAGSHVAELAATPEVAVPFPIEFVRYKKTTSDTSFLSVVKFCLSFNELESVLPKRGKRSLHTIRHCYAIKTDPFLHLWVLPPRPSRQATLGAGQQQRTEDLSYGTSEILGGCSVYTCSYHIRISSASLRDHAAILRSQQQSMFNAPDMERRPRL